MSYWLGKAASSLKELLGLSKDDKKNGYYSDSPNDNTSFRYTDYLFMTLESLLLHIITCLYSSFFYTTPHALISLFVILSFILLTSNGISSTTPIVSLQEDNVNWSFEEVRDAGIIKIPILLLVLTYHHRILLTFNIILQ